MNAKTAIALLFGLLAVGCSKPEQSDSLTGAISSGGAVVGNATVIVVGPGGEEVGVLSNESGVYRIVNPPKGTLKFKLTGFAPPPPPGKGAASVPAGDPRIPPRYHTTENELAFEYSGGHRVYDIVLKN